MVHCNHQQDAILLSWEGMVAGTDGSVDERTECMGAGYVVGDAVAPLMTLSLRVGGPLASVRAEAAKQPVCFNSCGMWLVSMGEIYNCWYL